MHDPLLLLRRHLVCFDTQGLQRASPSAERADRAKWRNHLRSDSGLNTHVHAI